MTKLAEKQISHLAKILADREVVLQAEIREELAANSDYASLAGSVTDRADEAVADLLADLGNANVSRDIRELRDIDEAKIRIKTGDYGVCRECGNGIRYERLIAAPAAIRCESCQRQYEKMFEPGTKPTL